MSGYEFLKARQTFSNYYNSFVKNFDPEEDKTFYFFNKIVFVLVETKLFTKECNKTYNEYLLFAFTTNNSYTPIDIEEILYKLPEFYDNLLIFEQKEFLDKYKEYYDYLKKYYVRALNISYNKIKKTITEIRNYLCYEKESYNPISTLNGCNIAAQCKSTELKKLNKLITNDFKKTEKYCICFVRSVRNKYKTNELDIDEKIDKYVDDYLKIVTHDFMFDNPPN